MLDSTDPGAVLELERTIDLAKTLFIVSSKSGGTVETLSHMKHFYERTGGNGSQFVAVTDPGSGLVDLAKRARLPARVRERPEHRRALLGAVVLRPRARPRVMGVDVRGAARVLAGGRAELQQLRHTRPRNSGLWMGLAMGELALQGRDKLTFIVSEPIASFGLWVEQLIAESTGKQGSGILPVADEPVGDPDAYGDDRVFAYLRNRDEPDEDLDAKVEELRKAGQAVLTLSTRRRPRTSGGSSSSPSSPPRCRAGCSASTRSTSRTCRRPRTTPPRCSRPPSRRTVDEAGDAALRALLGGAGPPSYVAIMAYVQPSEEFDEAVAELRAAIRDATKATTTFGYGPRFLHSTGQFHKGGPPTGRLPADRPRRRRGRGDPGRRLQLQGR